MSEWLHNLKVGDKVVIVDSCPRSLTTVKRLTKTLIITEKGLKFRRKDGHASGEWSTSFLQEPTPIAVDQIKHANLVSRLQHCNWKSLPLETLRAVYALLPKSS